MTAAAFTTEIMESDGSARRTVAAAEADAPRTGLRLPRLDPRRCDRAESSDFRAAPSKARRISASSRRCASGSGSKAWFETGCLSAHYRNPAFEGEEVQANIEKPKPGQTTCAIGMTKRDGTEILRGTASVGGDGSGNRAVASGSSELKPLADPVILADIKAGMKTDAPDREDGFRPATWAISIRFRWPRS